MSWQELISRQVLHCPKCGGYGVVLQFRGDVVHTKCSCGYSKTEPVNGETYARTIRQARAASKAAPSVQGPSASADAPVAPTPLSLSSQKLDTPTPAHQRSSDAES